MSGTLGTKIVHCLWRICGELRTYGALTVEYSQRILVKSVKTGVAKLILTCIEIIVKRLMILGTAVTASDGVDFKTNARKSKLTENR